MNRLEEVKKRKPFAAGDIIVYAALALVVIALFCVFVFFRGESEAEGFVFEREGEILYTYEFSRGGVISAAGKDFVSVKEEEGGVFVTVRTKDQTGYNLVYIDREERTARVTEADCSRTPDCVYTAPIQAGRGVILCVPHGLKILPLAGEDFSPSTG